MKILWATPFNKFSAIGRFSEVVCAELTRAGHTVEVMRSEIGESLALPPRSTALPIVSIEALGDASAWDLVVANLGNHAPFHGNCLPIFARCAPFLILHDAEMRDFAWGTGQLMSLDLSNLLPSGVDPNGDDTFLNLEARRHLGYYASMSSGAAVHGPHYLKSVADCCPGDVGVLPLCFPDIGAIERQPAAGPPYRIVVFGHINPNKQVERVMQAASLLASRFRTELFFVGLVTDQLREHCRALARNLGISAPTFFGEVSDIELCQHLSTAHVVCCLRYPVSEGGSASLATALYAARPVIVANAASYSMVPDECVWKVSYGEVPDDVADAIAAILKDPSRAEDRARQGRAWALDAFSVKRYVAGLSPMLTAALGVSPWLRTVRDVFSALPEASAVGNSLTADTLAMIVSQLSAGRK